MQNCMCVCLCVCVRDAASCRKMFVDACVTCAHSIYQPRQRVRAGRDGAAAADAVRGKRSRFLFLGANSRRLFSKLVEVTVIFVRSWGLELDQAERSNIIRYAWQKYSTVLQSGNAEMILSAND